MPKKFSKSMAARRRRKGALERLVRQKELIVGFLADDFPGDEWRKPSEVKLARINREIITLEGRL